MNSSQYVPQSIIDAAHPHYELENAIHWANYDKLLQFITSFLMENSPVATHQSSSPFKGSSGSSEWPSSPLEHITRIKTQDIERVEYSDNESNESENSNSVALSSKRKRFGGRKPHPTLESQRLAAGLKKITRLLYVSHISHTTSLSAAWDMQEDGESIAHILDLSQDKHSYKDQGGNLLSMTQIILNAVIEFFLTICFRI